MAQRVSLIQMPTDLLQEAVEAICGDFDRRKRFSANLAERSVPHLRRVTVSERVAAAAGGELSEAWSFAHNCLPYLIAETQAEEMCARIQELEALSDEGSLEDHFVQAAKKLGKTPATLDREEFKVPAAQVVQQRILNSLEKCARVRLAALEAVKAGATIEDEGNPIGNYVGSTWIWLGRMFARTHLCFWQGRDRWLGGAAFADELNIQSRITTFGPRPSLWSRFKAWLTGGEPEVDAELAEMISASQAETRRQMGSIRLSDLRAILVSTVDLAPRLEMAAWREYLPPHGSGNLVAGAVPFDQLDRLVSVMRAASGSQESGKEWLQLVIAAAVWAKKAGAHLVEGDDVTFGWWPILDPDEADSTL